jgi:O-antigen/teichoic acid export membrane protein
VSRFVSAIKPGGNGFASRSVQTTGWSAANVAIATGVGMVTARALGVELRGTLALMLSSAGLIVLLAALGTNVAIRRRLPHGQTSIRQYLQVSCALFVALAVLASLVTVPFAAYFDPAFGRAPVAVSFVAYCLTFFWSNQLLDLLNALGRIVMSAAINAAGTAVCFAAVLVSVTMGGDLVHIALSYSAAMVVQISLSQALIRRAERPAGRRQEGRRSLVRQGSLMLGLNLGQAITYRADNLLIGAFSSPAAVGIYAVAITPAALLRLPATAVGQVLFHDSATGAAGSKQVWKRVAQVEMVLVGLAAGGSLLADHVIVLLFGPAFADSAGVFRVLLIAELSLAPFLILSRVLVGRGGTWHASISGIAGAATLIGMGLILIPPYGAYGGAWASVAAYSVMSAVAALQVVINSKNRPVSQLEAS